MITFQHKGDFSKFTKFLEKAKENSKVKILDKYAQKGVEALMSATPIDTGKTANSWYYEIKKESNNLYRVDFCNSNIVKGIPIAIILQTGHGTGNGGWVEGRDYINPAIQPIFDELAKKAWKEVIGDEYHNR